MESQKRESCISVPRAKPSIAEELFPALPPLVQKVAGPAFAPDVSVDDTRLHVGTCLWLWFQLLGSTLLLGLNLLLPVAPRILFLIWWGCTVLVAAGGLLAFYRFTKTPPLSVTLHVALVWAATGELVYTCGSPVQVPCSAVLAVVLVLHCAPRSVAWWSFAVCTVGKEAGLAAVRAFLSAPPPGRDAGPVAWAVHQLAVALLVLGPAACVAASQRCRVRHLQGDAHVAAHRAAKYAERCESALAVNRRLIGNILPSAHAEELYELLLQKVMGSDNHGDSTVVSLATASPQLSPASPPRTAEDCASPLHAQRSVSQRRSGFMRPEAYNFSQTPQAKAAPGRDRHGLRAQARVVPPAIQLPGALQVFG